ncbi:group II intron reverse transcriptase/maturase [Chitinophaga agri]|uniref:RNA-directed DNA polymerase n=1 Tax=Chitinophaga agri TaxID=2703787 RepID=A0A6B9ZH29_9BACT|nr:group II intron reverse transcriptase/maturase [Chitinophaga agri]QHS58382.1 group II intron reverse transcriptase/maturase [Chitinophaga agri]QHS61059.1 group II intron reverse transcriptase/maturase [Chitinophaga agri]
MIDYYETKQHPVTKKMVLDAYKKVKENNASGGIDGESIEDFSIDASKNLYRIWNRMTSGCYYPPVVKSVEIPKKSGGVRILGIPTISDRIAQQVVKNYLEPIVEGSFHEDSYGYRPGKNAHQALEKATARCGYYSWVVDIDIRAFFDSIDHELLLKAIEWYTKEKWILMYIKRWLKAGIMCNGEVRRGEKGTPQGGVISPLLANIFLHFVFDKWMEKNHSNMPFERYCDDAIIHCTTEKQANFIKGAITRRMIDCQLMLNEEKTRIVYCKNHIHTEAHRSVSFDFLGYTFRPLGRPTKNGWKLMYFPCMSDSSKKAVRQKVREVVRRRFQGTILNIARILNPKIRGWYQYYCVYSKWTTHGLWYWLNLKLVRWIMENRKLGKGRAHIWLVRVYETNPRLFEHWSFIRPY